MIALCAPLLLGGACEKKTNAKQDTGAINAIDRTGPIDTSPIKGVVLGKLDGEQQKTFYKLAGTLKSPCGAGHSLRTSITTDPACKRGPFAAKYIIALLEDEVTEDKVVEEYTKKYDGTAKKVKLDVSKAPRVGNNDAPVRLVEFYDYACPHCYHFREIMKKVASSQQGKVAEYFMMYPLGKKEWPHSKSAAQAAVAAYQQGKFEQMHEVLFERGMMAGAGRPPPHSEADVMVYAKEIGLDVAKFAADYKAAEAQVDGDRKQGEAAGVSSTPTLYFNDRQFELDKLPAQHLDKYLAMWIEEEEAVNR